MQHQFLDALLLSGTLDEACRRTGITRGVALAARARDAMFALAWDRVNDTRLAELESLLLEKAVRGLDPEADASGSAQEKFVASLGQWFLEARAGHRYGRLKGAAAQKAVTEQPAETEPGDAATEVKKLISQTAARLEAMEKGRG